MSSTADQPDTIHIRRMTAADVNDVMAIERRAYPFPWSEGIFRDCLRVGYGCWIIEHKGEIHGYGIMMAGAGEAHILNLCVKPESRGQGLGRMMLEHLIDQSRRIRVQIVFLEVRPSNQAAINLYLSAGFNELSVRKGYYPADGGREDALILARHL
ncbi:MAG: ribosomal protein S18-alanine N-acetyltransferase [Gammaproteobacteria bacterium]|nr:ribosomal protein S18-alanine N-acetyltransferase [Gammaproteobacteria bacterium]